MMDTISVTMPKAFWRDMLDILTIERDKWQVIVAAFSGEEQDFNEQIDDMCAASNIDEAVAKVKSYNTDIKLIEEQAGLK